VPFLREKLSNLSERKVIKEVVVKKERKKEFKISRVDRFRYKTRYEQ